MPERRPSDIKDSDVYNMCKYMDAKGKAGSEAELTENECSRSYDIEQVSRGQETESRDLEDRVPSPQIPRGQGKVLQWLTDTADDDSGADGDKESESNTPKKPRDPLLRHNCIDDEMRFSGLHTKADIPSKAFQRLHKIAGTETKSPSPTQAQNNRQNDDALTFVEEDRVGNYDEASIRYRGKHMPSPSFSLLQACAKEEEMNNKPPIASPDDDDDDGMPYRLNEEDMVDKRYTGGNIPSKSFKALQMFVEYENKPASDSEGGGHKIQVVSRSRSPKVAPKPDRPSNSPLPHAPAATKAPIRHAAAPTSDF